MFLSAFVFTHIEVTSDRPLFTLYGVHVDAIVPAIVPLQPIFSYFVKFDRVQNIRIPSIVAFILYEYYPN